MSKKQQRKQKSNIIPTFDEFLGLGGKGPPIPIPFTQRLFTPTVSPRGYGKQEQTPGGSTGGSVPVSDAGKQHQATTTTRKQGQQQRQGRKKDFSMEEGGFEVMPQHFDLKKMVATGGKAGQKRFYRGVQRHTNGKWKAIGYKDKEKYNLGEFQTAQQAAKAYDEFVRIHYGPRAVTNFNSAGQINLNRKINRNRMKGGGGGGKSSASGGGGGGGGQQRKQQDDFGGTLYQQMFREYGNDPFDWNPEIQGIPQQQQGQRLGLSTTMTRKTSSLQPR